MTKILKQGGLVMLLLTSLVNCSAAQNPTCDAAENFRAFDFWIGQWDVYDNSTGNLAGSNSITIQEQGCALLENWSGVGGSTGISLNYFNPLRDEWRQLWVSAGNYAIDISGGPDNGAMVLTGELYNYGDGETYDFRGSWTPNADGSVRQFFEQFNAGTGAWEPWFDGRYVRKTYVGVYKADGSLQCEDGGISPASMAQELNDAGIAVACMQQGNDGMMRAAVCGGPTGNINIFEISELDVPAAQELGFAPLAALTSYAGESCE